MISLILLANNNEIKLSIVGHPNVGKSSIFNLLTESNRSIVSDIPGTTRDSIDFSTKYQNKSIKFIDTVGLRRRGKNRTRYRKIFLNKEYKVN